MSRRSGVLALAVLTFLVVIFASYARTVRSEVDDASGYLLTLMELRRSALEDYLETIRSEVVLWSHREALRGAIVELEQRYPAASIVVPGHGDPGGLELLVHTRALLAP